MTATLDLLAQATPAELAEYERLLEVVLGEWRPLPYQEPPSLDDDSWDIWALIGGRGTGKTDAGAATLDRLLTDNAGWRGRIIAPTLDDAKEACIDGPTGLKAHNRQLKANYNDHLLLWPNGSRARWYGMNDPESPERLRAGGNAHVDWFEELAAQKFAEAGWVQADFGRRLGKHPRAIITTTPRARPIVRWLLGRPLDQAMVERHPWMRQVASCRISRASTDDNPHLEQRRRDQYEATYSGTRLGRQELTAELLEDVEGALWLQATIDGLRGDPPTRKVRYPGSSRDASGLSDEYDMPQVVVGVDPAASSSEDSDETGIVVAGRGSDGLLYVLADQSVRATPDGWGRRVIDACEDHGADEIVAEANNGGEMVSHVLRTVAQSLGMTPPIIRLVHASRGKRLRAEPIAAIYEQRRARHCGTFAALEQQMTEWVPDSPQSPDRLDALVWAATRLMIESRPRLRFRGAA